MAGSGRALYRSRIILLAASTLPGAGAGSLKLNGAAVAAGDLVSSSAIALGGLKFFLKQNKAKGGFRKDFLVVFDKTAGAFAENGRGYK